MPKILHRTNRTTSSAPATSELSEGEIGINNYTLGTSVNGFNNGRLYIKLSDGSVKRFIGLGLPGDTDASLKTNMVGRIIFLQLVAQALLMQKYNLF